VRDAVVGDSHHFGQVISNLIYNAIKFTDPGSGLIEIELGLAQDGAPDDGQQQRIVGRVRDNGTGIPRENWEAVFEPHNLTRSPADGNRSGIGLGLSICRRIVEKMGGQIRIEDSILAVPGQEACYHGTTVLFEVLLEASGPPGEPPAPAEFRGRTALVAEEHAARREVLAGVLLAWGMEARTVSDLDEARGLPVRQVFDVVLTDPAFLGMLGGGDFGPVVPMTPHKPRGAERLGTQPLLHKPVARNKLREALSDVFGLPRSSAGPQGQAPGDRPLRILLVDNDNLDRELPQRLLTNLGHTVFTAASGKEALQEVRLRPFDLLVLDVRLGDMIGLEVARAIKGMREWPAGGPPKILALSADLPHEEAELRQWYSCGIDACLRKGGGAASCSTRSAKSCQPERVPRGRPSSAGRSQPGPQGPHPRPAAAICRGTARSAGRRPRRAGQGRRCWGQGLRA
jgi:CheY-like chemotaxis protein